LKRKRFASPSIFDCRLPIADFVGLVGFLYFWLVSDWFGSLVSHVRDQSAIGNRQSKIATKPEEHKEGRIIASYFNHVTRIRPSILLPAAG
jgi:hypothetical protein